MKQQKAKKPLISLLILFTIVSIFACKQPMQERLTDYVNPFIGTDEDGHTFPGALVSFAMVDTEPSNKIIRSEFSHADESAKPGYYSVLLKTFNIKAELTTTVHCGMHRYTLSLIHISEPTRRTPISYAVFCLKKK